MKNIIKEWLGIHNTRSDFIEWTEELFQPCYKCRYICRVYDMKKITVRWNFDRYYCMKCAPKYDEIVFGSSYDGIWANSFKQPNEKYYKNNVEVDKNGKPICTKK